MARIAAIISAGLLAAAPAAGAAPAGFFAAAKISGVLPAFAAAGFDAARAAAMISAVLFGAAAGAALPTGVATANGAAGVSEVAPDSAAAAEAALARIFARMSFVEGFGSVIQPCQPSEGAAL